VAKYRLAMSGPLQVGAVEGNQTTVM